MDIESFISLELLFHIKMKWSAHSSSIYQCHQTVLMTEVLRVFFNRENSNAIQILLLHLCCVPIQFS
jgi:hypothetical protein